MKSTWWLCAKAEQLFQKRLGFVMHFLVVFRTMADFQHRHSGSCKIEELLLSFLKYFKRYGGGAKG